MKVVANPGCMSGSELCNDLIVHYIRERRCTGGGYCFYRLPEPNGSDTYHALSSLRLLDRLEQDDETAAFLLDRQTSNGAYESIFQAYYCLKSLSILGLEPKTDPSTYILQHLRAYDVDCLPVGVTSIFYKLMTVIELRQLQRLSVTFPQKESLTDFLFRYQQIDGGFGYPHSTLVETYQATRILVGLNYPVTSLGVDCFLAACEDPVFGFINMPRAHSAFLEHVSAGIGLSEFLNREVKYGDIISTFIRACQSRNGGFSRATHAGIASLEYTHMAVDALAIISRLRLG